MTLVITDRRTANSAGLALQSILSPRSFQRRQAKAMSVATARVRRTLIESIDDHIDAPVAFTKNRGSVRFVAAKERDPISRQRTIVHLGEIQNEYLKPQVLGETINELYGASPFFVPVVANLRRSGFRLGLKLNRFGNVPGLFSGSGEGKLNKILNDPRVFIGGPEDGLAMGIYTRDSDGSPIALFVQKERQAYKANWPFHRIALKSFRDEYPRAFREARR